MAWLLFGVVFGIVAVVVYLYFRRAFSQKDCSKETFKDKLQDPIPKFPEDKDIKFPEIPEQNNEDTAKLSEKKEIK